MTEMSRAETKPITAQNAANSQVVLNASIMVMRRAHQQCDSLSRLVWSCPVSTLTKIANPQHGPYQSEGVEHTAADSQFGVRHLRK